MTSIPNVLASRYGSSEMTDIWSPEGKIVLEREFWLALIRAQSENGIAIPSGAVEAYEKCLTTVDMQSIQNREASLKHDVKARIEEFNALAGFSEVHKGMTSRDLTENVEQYQIVKSLAIVRAKVLSTLLLFAEHAKAHSSLVLAARSHNVVAQPTTLGKRFACYGEELLYAYRRLVNLVDAYPLRGLKGAVGTQQDQLTLVEGDTAKLDSLEAAVLKHLGISRKFENVGQVYPRSLDFDVVSTLCLLASGPANFAKTLRLMAGHELVSEGFAKGQVGSSAMPHKMNSRSAERITGFHTLLKGYVTTASGLAGDQWNEGDVSCSVVRRVLLQDAFLAVDALLDTTRVILRQLQVYPKVISQELSRYSPFLATTTLLMEAVKKGKGREEMHTIIKKHAVATANDLRQGAVNQNDLGDRLAADPNFPLERDEVKNIIHDVQNLVGGARTQVAHFEAVVTDLSKTDLSWKAVHSKELDIL